MHYPESRFYIRRVRLGMDHPLVPALRHAGYKVEPAVEGRDTAVVEIPVDVGPNVRTCVGRMPGLAACSCPPLAGLRM